MPAGWFNALMPTFSVTSLNLPAAFVVKQHHAITQRDRKIVLAVVVVVADCARDPLPFSAKPKLRQPTLP